MTSPTPLQTSVALTDPVRAGNASLYSSPDQLHALVTDLEEYARFQRRVMVFAGLYVLAGGVMMMGGLTGLILFVVGSSMLLPASAFAIGVKYLINRERLVRNHTLTASERRGWLRTYRRWRRTAGREYIAFMTPPRIAADAYVEDMLGSEQSDAPGKPVSDIDHDQT